jgi:hypothetical protein
MRKLREKDDVPTSILHIRERRVVTLKKRLFAIRAARRLRLCMRQDAQCKDGMRLYGELHGVSFRAEREL